ncbi:MAG: DNA methyltransferase, partial [Pseudomonas sp.]
GWGSALKPAWEPICLARKPLIGTIAENVLAHAVGGLNIQGCRVGDEVLPEMTAGQAKLGTFERHDMVTPERVGRWPANIIHDGSDEVVAAFPAAPGQQRAVGPEHGEKDSKGIYGDFGAREHFAPRIELEKSAARFFYCAKASRADRDAGLAGAPFGPQFEHGTTLRKVEDAPKKGNTHPTVKPTSLMQWLCRLITPPGGVILDPFLGSGSTGKAAVLEGFQFIGCEREDEYMPISTARIAWAIGATDKEEPQQERQTAVAQAQPAATPVVANDNTAPNDLFSRSA